MMMGYGYGMGFACMLIYMLIMVGVLYLVVKLVVGNGTLRRKEEKQAEHILGDRFARGDITEEQFMRMKEVLHK